MVSHRLFSPGLRAIRNGRGLRRLIKTTDSAGRELRQSGDTRVRARMLEAKAELERIDALR